MSLLDAILFFIFLISLMYYFFTAFYVTETSLLSGKPPYKKFDAIVASNNSLRAYTRSLKVTMVLSGGALMIKELMTST